MTQNNVTPPELTPEIDWKTTPPEMQPPEFDPSLPAWEQTGFWLSAFAKTTVQILFRPFLTLQKKAYPGAVSLIAFALPWLVLASCLTLLRSSGAGHTTFTIAGLLSNLINSAVLFVVSLLLLHLALIIVRADKNGLKATFRANAYLCCTYVWLLIPWIGPLLAPAWAVAIIFSLLAASQQVSRRRILGAILVLMGMFSCVALILLIIVGMATVTQMLQLLEQGLKLQMLWQ